MHNISGQDNDYCTLKFWVFLLLYYPIQQKLEAFFRQMIKKIKKVIVTSNFFLSQFRPFFS